MHLYQLIACLALISSAFVCARTPCRRALWHLAIHQLLPIAMHHPHHRSSPPRECMRALAGEWMPRGQIKGRSKSISRCLLQSGSSTINECERIPALFVLRVLRFCVTRPQVYICCIQQLFVPWCASVDTEDIDDIDFVVSATRPTPTVACSNAICRHK